VATSANTHFGTNPIAVQAIFSNDFRLGMTQSWNASVEQQFGRDFALHLAYVGSESYRQDTVLDQNPRYLRNGGALGVSELLRQIHQRQSRHQRDYRRSGLRTQ
jgi:hypothetical protein